MQVFRTFLNRSQTVTAWLSKLLIALLAHALLSVTISINFSWTSAWKSSFYSHYHAWGPQINVQTPCTHKGSHLTSILSPFPFWCCLPSLAPAISQSTVCQYSLWSRSRSAPLYLIFLSFEESAQRLAYALEGYWTVFYVLRTWIKSWVQGSILMKFATLVSCANLNLSFGSTSSLPVVRNLVPGSKLNQVLG